VAPDISVLDKPLGLKCPHLGPDNLCMVYDRRPDTCCNYSADELCARIDAPTLEERVQKYLAHFSVEDEAKRIKASGVTSLREWRKTRWTLD
jgi:Fe-S-cluster containining protein